MTKRTFLKLMSGTPAGWVWERMARAAGEKLTNWAGNVAYGTERLTAVASVEEARAFVRAHERLKVLGTKHCFNRIADSGDRFLSVRGMEELSIDEAARTATVGAGISYGRLSPELDRKGWALHNLASLPHISVAGAATTATHGSGEKNGNLATAVVGLELVNGSGDLMMLTQDRDGDAFRGAVVGLGALGVITKITLKIQPTFQIKQYVYQDMPLAEAMKNFDRIQAAGYSVSLFTDWQGKRIAEVWIKSRVGGAGEFAAPKEFFGGRLAAKNLHPIAELDAVNCTEQMGVAGAWYDRLPHFKMGFTPSAGKELQSEYFVERRHAVEAILALERLRDEISPHLLISEIRTIAADDLWLSMAHRRESVALHFTWKPEWESVQKILPKIEQELGPFEARPHWGKLFTLPGTEVRKRYEKMQDFVTLARKCDPSGKFRNEFLRRNVFGA